MGNLSMVRAATVGLVMAAGLPATEAGAATLLGDTVSASLNTPFTSTLRTRSTTVGAGHEFEIGDNGPRAVLVDLDATMITLTYNGVQNADFDSSLGDTVLSLTNLSFGAGIGGIAAVEFPPLGEGGSIVPGFFGGNTVAFDATSVFVTLRGIWSGNASLVITLTEKQTTEPPPPVVPLPASAVLLLAGLGGLAAMRRRRAG